MVRCSRQKHLRAAPLSRSLNDAELVVRRSLVRGSGNDCVVLPVTNRKVVWQRTEIGTMTPNRSYPRSSDRERISYGKF